jgi:hypothetical protein
MSFRAEILTERQRKALRLLGPRTAPDGFYLAGGTAIALHLGHRRSVDFDWFRADPLAEPLQLALEIRHAGIPFLTGQVARSTLYGTVYGVRVSFFEFRYPMLDPFLPWPEYGCQLAGLRDLACMKLSAITQRGSKKDFVDLYALGRNGFRLAEMLDWYRRKFEVEDISHVLYALVYFDDADPQPKPKMLWKADWKEIKKTITGWVRGL